MNWRTAGLYLGFGAVIVCAMGASYLHLAAWLQPWMPPGWERLSYMSALAIDGMVLAPIMARQIVGGPVPGLALPMAQALGVVASIYVNVRWGAANVAGATWADVGVGAAILPVFALVMEHAMRATLAALQAQKARQERPAPASPAPRRATTSAPALPAPATMALIRTAPTPPAPPPGATPRGPAAWPDLVARHGDDTRAIADATGTPLRTVQRWRRLALQA